MISRTEEEAAERLRTKGVQLLVRAPEPEVRTYLCDPDHRARCAMRFDRLEAYAIHFLAVHENLMDEADRRFLRGWVAERRGS